MWWVNKWLIEVIGYAISLGVAGFFWTLDKLGAVKIIGRERLPKELKKIILVSNHPSFWEPILLVYLFYPQYIFDFKLVPYNLPDAKNYYKKWFSFLWWPARLRFIPVERSERGVLNFRQVYRQMSEVLITGGNIIVFPEGGRTSSASSDKEFLMSPKGNRIRRFSNGAAAVALSTKATIVPVWLNGMDKVLPREALIPRIWRKCSVKIGRPIEVGVELDKHNLNQFLEKAILALADE